MKPKKYILAFDTSCDDTSAAVTCGYEVISNVVASQTQLHKQYGGVFPTVAKQAHKENIEAVGRAALRRAHLTPADLAGVAVTTGPGLAPALEVGIAYAQQFALKYDLPFIPVNHIEGHVLSPLAQPRKLSSRAKTVSSRAKSRDPHFPILSLVVSGGHTDFIRINALGDYIRLGFSVDDAAGEALDKFGRMLDLGYPAGPLIEQFARQGNPHKFTFPLPMTTSGDFNLSFSGLKTAGRKCLEHLQATQVLTQQDIFDLCASFQFAVFRAITYKLGKILQKDQYAAVFLGGGVAANVALRQTIRHTLLLHAKASHTKQLTLHTPYTKRLCMDNGAMIGIVAVAKLERGEVLTTPAEIMAVERLPRWEIGEI